MQKKTAQNAIFFLSLIGFFGIFTTTIAKNPVLSLYIQSLNGSDAVIGLIAAVSPLAGIVFSFPVGLMSDRIGKKKLLVVSALVFVTAPLLYLFIQNAFWLIPVRFFHGIATAILGPVASAVICGAYPKSKGEKLGLYSSATLIGRTIAPLAGGAIITLFLFLPDGWNYRMVYILGFIASIPVLIFALMLKEDNQNEQVKRITLRDFTSSLKSILLNPRILGTSLVEMAAYFCYGAFETFIPVYLKGRGYPAYQIGLIFSIQVFSLALSKPFFGKLSDRVNRKTQITIGILILGASLALTPLSSSIWVILGLGILFGLGLAFATVATSTYVADIAKKENLGASMGALSSIMDIGHSSGPLITGVIVTAFSLEAGFLGCLAVSIAAAFLFVILNLKGFFMKDVKA